MAHGFSRSYSMDEAETDCRRIFDGEDPSWRSLISTKSMEVERPSRIENLIYCGELRKKHGDISDVKGFDADGNFILAVRSGILVPVWVDGRITELTFYSHSELRAKKAA